MSVQGSRRQFIKGSLGLAATSFLPVATAQRVFASDGRSPSEVAQDETFWQKVSGFYDRPAEIINLEQGYWGQMSNPVQQAYLNATKMVNQQNSYYARKNYQTDLANATQSVAQSLGAAANELVLTRNATEGFHNLIRQYQGLKSTDAILWADIDYPDFKTSMQWLAGEHKVQAVKIDLPATATQQDIFSLYEATFNKHPNIKLMLLTHVSNQHGLVLPVKAISSLAKSRGIDLICDCAQSWGLLDFKVTDLGVDWAVFNLHKWIGAPVGVGALYMKTGTLTKVAPHPGEQDPEQSKTAARVHMATANFAAFITVPDALAFHHAVGGPYKEARLNYLRQLWTTEAKKMAWIEVLGGKDEMSRSGMAAFRVKGKNTEKQMQAIQQRLELEFNVFTVVRNDLVSGSCIRVTPQIFTRLADIKQLVYALQQLS